MKSFLGNMTVRIKGANAADAIQRFINPTIPGTEAEIISVGVTPEYEAPIMTSAYLQGAGDAYVPDPLEDLLNAPEPEPLFNEEYNEEDNVDMDDLIGLDEDDCKGCPEEPTHMELPSDFPYIGTLRREGETLDSIILKVQNGTVKDIKGVGSTAVDKITSYLQKTGRLPIAEAVKEDDLLDPTPSTPEPRVEPSAPSTKAPSAPTTSSEVDVAEMRQAMAEVARVHKLPALKAMLAEFGASGLGDLSEEHYPAALAAANKMLGK